MNKTILTVIVLAITLVSKGQVFRDKALYYDSGIHFVKTKHYNGVDRKAYLTVDVVDAKGQTIERKCFGKNKLSNRTKYLYNSNGDVIRTIDFDYLNSFQADTIVNEFEYSDGRIVLQKEVSSYGDSTISKLVNANDSDLTYQRTFYHYLPDKKRTNQVQQTYTFTYENDLLIS